MKDSSVSDCSYPEYDIVDDIATTFARLRYILSEEAMLRKQLDALFIKQEEGAERSVRKAQSHLAFVKNEQANKKEVIRQESINAYEIYMALPIGDSGRVDVRPVSRVPTPAMNTPIATLMDSNLSDIASPKCPARSIAEIAGGGQQNSPARSIHSLYNDAAPQIASKSICDILDELPRHRLQSNPAVPTSLNLPLAAVRSLRGLPLTHQILQLSSLMHLEHQNHPFVP